MNWRMEPRFDLIMLRMLGNSKNKTGKMVLLARQNVSIVRLDLLLARLNALPARQISFVSEDIMDLMGHCCLRSFG